MWQQIKQLLADNQKFLLTTHAPPDGDGVGSAIALSELLLAMGKEPRIVCDAPLPLRFHFLDARSLYESFDPAADYSADLVILLDAHRPDRLGRLSSVLPDSLACIDHHTPSNPPSFPSVIDPEACSVGAMIYTLFKTSGYPLNLTAANAIYTSIICDTGRFSYSSTSRKAHKLADECIKIGVDPDLMHIRLFQQIPFSYLSLFSAALARTELHADGRCLIQTVLRSDYEPLGIDANDLDYLHEINKSIAGVECAILLRELLDGEIRLSFRTHASVDALALASHFGGGGHSRAAGATASGSVESIKKQILSTLPFSGPRA